MKYDQIKVLVKSLQSSIIDINLLSNNDQIKPIVQSLKNTISEIKSSIYAIQSICEHNELELMMYEENKGKPFPVKTCVSCDKLFVDLTNHEKHKCWTNWENGSIR